MKLYAAYGSNLNLSQMMYRCPDATVYGRATLPDHELVFRGRYSGVATIEPREGSSVPILLWKISARDEESLDIYEGWPRFYGKETLEFQAGNERVSAMAYVMTPGHEPAQPSEGYYETIREGYDDCGFDLTVLEQALERTAELMAAGPEWTPWNGGPALG